MTGWAEVARRDLKPFGVTVHVVVPGIFKSTSLYGNFTSGLDATWRSLPADLKRDYGEGYYKTVRGGLDFALNSLSNADPGDVSDAMLHACTAERPRYRYDVGRDARFVYPVLAAFPDSWADAVMSGGARPPRAALPATAPEDGPASALARYDAEWPTKLAVLGAGALAARGAAAVVRRALL